MTRSASPTKRDVGDAGGEGPGRRPGERVVVGSQDDVLAVGAGALDEAGLESERVTAVGWRRRVRGGGVPTQAGSDGHRSSEGCHQHGDDGG